jgi:hypothetical protein
MPAKSTPGASRKPTSLRAQTDRVRSQAANRQAPGFVPAGRKTATKGGPGKRAK